MHHVPKKYENMKFEEKMECFHALNEQLELNVLNDNEKAELAGLAFILLTGQ